MYVDAAADLDEALEIVVNSKTNRPSVCNAAETLLVHVDVADRFLPRVAAVLGECTVVATGGLSELIAPYSDEIEYVEPWLTLHGLRIIFDRNSPIRPAPGEG